MNNVEKYYNAQSEEIKKIFSDNGVKHTVKIMVWEYNKNLSIGVVDLVNKYRNELFGMMREYIDLDPEDVKSHLYMPYEIARLEDIIKDLNSLFK